MSDKVYIQNDNGVYRHAVSGNIVPPDVLREGGYPVSEIHQIAYDDDLAKVIAAYRKSQANLTDEQRAERAWEMRTAFGEGETVINVFTGEEFTT